MAKVRVRRKKRKPVKPSLGGQTGLLTDRIVQEVQKRKEQL